MQPPSEVWDRSHRSREEICIPGRSRSKFRIVAPERDSTRVNERIRAAEIMVIGADSEQLGVMTPGDAIVLAEAEGLDLVEVAATSRPPVCRIMDYGKYKYEQKKKAGKPAHSATLKEIKLRPGTDQHDLDFKLNNVRRFLMDGDKVKVTVMFRGREMVHTARGRAQLVEVTKQLGAIAKTENPPRMEGRFMSMILIGDREVIADFKRKEESEKAISDEAAGGTEESPVIDAGPELADATETEPTETAAAEIKPIEEAATQIVDEGQGAEEEAVS
jgi:translation initiation factor IF-3